MLKNVYVAGGVRTPVGSFGGPLSGISAAELGSTATRHALERCGFDPADIDGVVLGNVSHAGLGEHVYRRALIEALLGPVTEALLTCRCKAIDMSALQLPGSDFVDRLPRDGAVSALSSHQLLLDPGPWDVYTDHHIGNRGDIYDRECNDTLKQ